jgi:hypothetical protein
MDNLDFKDKCLQELWNQLHVYVNLPGAHGIPKGTKNIIPAFRIRPACLSHVVNYGQEKGIRNHETSSSMMQLTTKSASCLQVKVHVFDKDKTTLEQLLFYLIIPL